MTVCLDCGTKSLVAVCAPCRRTSKESHDVYMRTTWSALQAIPTRHERTFNYPNLKKDKKSPMARITSSAENTVIMTSFPPQTIVSYISAIENTTSKTQEDGTGGNPMAVVEFTTDEGEFKGRRVGFHNVMLGGKTKKGDPMPIRTLLELIDACKVPWTTTPGGTLAARPFKKVKGDGGVIIFVDPDTNTRITTIEYDLPDDFINKRCRVKYGVRKQDGSDREFNTVEAVLPL